MSPCGWPWPLLLFRAWPEGSELGRTVTGATHRPALGLFVLTLWSSFFSCAVAPTQGIFLWKYCGNIVKCENMSLFSCNSLFTSCVL